MKKNLLSVLILALLVVNIVMTALMMISITSTNSKTADMVNSVMAVMNMELYNPGGGTSSDVPIADTATHDMAGSLTIPLKVEAAADGTMGKSIYIVFDMSLFMNTKHEDYKKYGESIENYESQIKDRVSALVSNYTEEECKGNGFDTNVRPEILREIQKLFESDFIFSIGVSNIKIG